MIKVTKYESEGLELSFNSQENIWTLESFRGLDVEFPIQAETRIEAISLAKEKLNRAICELNNDLRDLAKLETILKNGGATE